jgi:hypothetical protein
MDKRIAWMFGAAAALTTFTAANAAVPSQANKPAQPTSYRDLLNPVSNAAVTLKADNARRAEAADNGVQLAQYFYRRHHHHHHHHHHHSYFRS